MKLIANIYIMFINTFLSTVSQVILSIPIESIFISMIMTFKCLSLAQTPVCYHIPLIFCSLFPLSHPLPSAPMQCFGLILICLDYYVTPLSIVTPSCSYKIRKPYLLSAQIIIASILTDSWKSAVITLPASCL